MKFRRKFRRHLPVTADYFFRTVSSNVYAGRNPLPAEDLAEALLWVATRPSYVNIDDLIIKPVDQADMRKFFRRKSEKTR